MYKKINVTGDNHLEQIKPVSERQLLCFLLFAVPRFLCRYIKPCKHTWHESRAELGKQENGEEGKWQAEMRGSMLGIQDMLSELNMSSRNSARDKNTVSSGHSRTIARLNSQQLGQYASEQPAQAEARQHPPCVHALKACVDHPDSHQG